MSPRLLIGMLVLPVLLAGCGDDADRKAKEAFIKQAEVICAKANADQKALTTPTAVNQLTPYVKRVVAIADTAATALLALEPPKKDVDELRAKVLEPLRAQVVVGKAYAAQVEKADKAGDQSKLLSLLASPPTETKADLRWMKTYGFTACIDAADTTS